MKDDIEKVVGKKESSEASQAFIHSFLNTYLWRYFHTTNDAEIRFEGSVFHRYPPGDDVDIRDFRERPVSLCANLSNGTEVD